jgi:hypothetical protein
VGQAEQLGNAVRIEQVIDRNLPTHRDQITALVGSVR